MDHNEETEERSEKKEKRFTLNPGVNVKNLNKNVIYLIAAGVFIFIFMIILTYPTSYQKIPAVHLYEKNVRCYP